MKKTKFIMQYLLLMCEVVIALLIFKALFTLIFQPGEAGIKAGKFKHNYDSVYYGRIP